MTINKKIKVLVLAPFPTDGDLLSGGVTSSVHYLADGLHASGEVELLAVGLGATTSEDWLPYRRIVVATGAYPLLFRFKSARKELLSIIQKFKPDVVHGHGLDIFGYAATRLFPSAVVTPHGLISQEIGLQSTVIQDLKKIYTQIALCNPTLRTAGSFISVSPFITRYLRSSGVSAKIYETHNAIGNHYFAIKPNPEPGLLLYLGRIRRLKGIITAIRAIALPALGSCRLVIAGSVDDARYHRAIINAIEKNNLTERVKLLGVQSDSSIIDLMSRAQALILPSLREVAPMVIQQAFAARLPVVASSVGGVPDQLLHGERGALFSPGDHNQLGVHITSILLGERTVAERVAKAWKYAENFSLSVVTQTHVDIYQNIVESAL